MISRLMTCASGVQITVITCQTHHKTIKVQHNFKQKLVKGGRHTGMQLAPHRRGAKDQILSKSRFKQKYKSVSQGSAGHTHIHIIWVGGDHNVHEGGGGVLGHGAQEVGQTLGRVCTHDEHM